MQTATHDVPSAASRDQCIGVIRVYRGVKAAFRKKHGDQGMRRVLAQNVRRHRLERGWSIKVLAARSRLAPIFVEQIEQGRRRSVRLGTVEVLARALQVDVLNLLCALGKPVHARAEGIKGSKVLSPKRRAPSRDAPRYRS